MIPTDKVLIIDIDGTICKEKKDNQEYSDLIPHESIVSKLKTLQQDGWHLTLFTARGMRSNDGNIGLINKNVLPTILEWLNKHKIPFNEIIVGKPWPGKTGFYIDDRAIRPREFMENSLEQLIEIVEKDKLEN